MKEQYCISLHSVHPNFMRPFVTGRWKSEHAHNASRKRSIPRRTHLITGLPCERCSNPLNLTDRKTCLLHRYLVHHGHKEGINQYPLKTSVNYLVCFRYESIMCDVFYISTADVIKHSLHRFCVPSIDFLYWDPSPTALNVSREKAGGEEIANRLLELQQRPQPCFCPPF